jgi:hypothetical protein
MSHKDKGKQSNKIQQQFQRPKNLLRKNENILLKRERKATRLVPSPVEQHTHVSNSKKSAKLQGTITQT